MNARLALFVAASFALPLVGLDAACARAEWHIELDATDTPSFVCLVLDGGDASFTESVSYEELTLPATDTARSLALTELSATRAPDSPAPPSRTHVRPLSEVQQALQARLGSTVPCGVHAPACTPSLMSAGIGGTAPRPRVQCVANRTTQSGSPFVAFLRIVPYGATDEVRVNGEIRLDGAHVVIPGTQSRGSSVQIEVQGGDYGSAAAPLETGTVNLRLTSRCTLASIGLPSVVALPVDQSWADPVDTARPREAPDVSIRYDHVPYCEAPATQPFYVVLPSAGTTGAAYTVAVTPARATQPVATFEGTWEHVPADASRAQAVTLRPAVRSVDFGWSVPCEFPSATCPVAHVEGIGRCREGTVTRGPTGDACVYHCEGVALGRADLEASLGVVFESRALVPGQGATLHSWEGRLATPGEVISAYLDASEPRPIAIELYSWIQGPHDRAGRAGDWVEGLRIFHRSSDQIPVATIDLRSIEGASATVPIVDAACGDQITYEYVGSRLRDRRTAYIVSGGRVRIDDPSEDPRGGNRELFVSAIPFLGGAVITFDPDRASPYAGGLQLALRYHPRGPLGSTLTFELGVGIMLSGASYRLPDQRPQLALALRYPLEIGVWLYPIPTAHGFAMGAAPLSLWLASPFFHADSELMGSFWAAWAPWFGLRYEFDSNWAIEGRFGFAIGEPYGRTAMQATRIVPSGADQPFESYVQLGFRLTL